MSLTYEITVETRPSVFSRSPRADGQQMNDEPRIIHLLADGSSAVCSYPGVEPSAILKLADRRAKSAGLIRTYHHTFDGRTVSIYR